MDYDEQSLNSMPTVVGGLNGRASSSSTPLGQIDQYVLIRKLGGGGFGVVYLARDTASDVDVALKTLHPLLKSNPEEMEALRANFALVSRLSHPNIASPLVLHPCREIAITDDTTRREMRLPPGDFIMVMRYAPGVTLSRWRRQFPNGVVPLDQALEVVRQVASALDYAHGEKIVHRDIKPANIMVETIGVSTTEKTENTEVCGTGSVHSVPSVVPKLRVRILDFGLAAEIRSSMSRISTETGDTSGTRPYMAPEQWQGRKQDGRTDQYALACVAYELLSGAPPFAGAFETGDPAIMMATVKGEAPEKIEDVPAHVNTALQKALAKNPKERFGNCTEFVSALCEKGRVPIPIVIPHIDKLKLKTFSKKAIRLLRIARTAGAKWIDKHSPHVRNVVMKHRIWPWVVAAALAAIVAIIIVGHSDAESFYAKGRNFYYGSDGFQQDYAEAVKWYRKAAKLGNAGGQNGLGVCYCYGHGVPQDYAEAIKWCRKAAEQGFAKAQKNLGTMYFQGQGVPQDYVEAVKWYRKAAEQGDAEAQNILGIMYKDGRGVPPNAAEAVKWFRMAAEQGDADGQVKLGYMYAKGYGVQQDYAEATKWFRKAAEQGNEDAKKSLGHLLKDYGL